MTQTTLSFGSAPTGQDAHLYLLGNAAGMLVGVSDLGANLVLCRVPDGKGHFPDVLLGHSGAAGYLDDSYNLGALVGRNANRIAGASFELSHRSYRLAANNGAHNLHSGPHKWSERLWKVTDVEDSAVTFELTSRDRDQGFPGSVQAHVTYRLSEANELTVFYSAIPSKPTIINLTNHAYWNLNGHASGNVLRHTLQIDAATYTPMIDQIPTGEIASVEGTPYDFRTARTLDSALDVLPHGYDDNFCLDNGGRVKKVARLVGDATGIRMDVATDACGMQMFTADYFDVPCGKDGMHYQGFAGVALETQHYPDAIHHKNFPQPVYTTMRPFVSTTIFTFGITEA